MGASQAVPRLLTDGCSCLPCLCCRRLGADVVVHSLTKFISGASGESCLHAGSADEVATALVFVLRRPCWPEFQLQPGMHLLLRQAFLRPAQTLPPHRAADIIGGAVCAADGIFINSLMDLHMGPLMLLGGCSLVAVWLDGRLEECSERDEEPWTRLALGLVLWRTLVVASWALHASVTVYSTPSRRPHDGPESGLRAVAAHTPPGAACAGAQRARLVLCR